jgi:hypothetical protein
MSGVEIGARPKSRTGHAADWAAEVLMRFFDGPPETSCGGARHLPLEKLAAAGERDTRCNSGSEGCRRPRHAAGRVHPCSMSFCEGRAWRLPVSAVGRSPQREIIEQDLMDADATSANSRPLLPAPRRSRSPVRGTRQCVDLRTEVTRGRSSDRPRP